MNVIEHLFERHHKSLDHQRNQAQRLSRQMERMDVEIAAYEHEMGKLDGQLYKGKGCNLCADTGYMGRVGLFEVLPITDTMKRLMVERAGTGEIRKQAIEEGMNTLMRDGLLKVKEGVTTVNEVLRTVFYSGA